VGGDTLKKLEEMSPQGLLTVVFMLSLLTFTLVALFPGWLYRTMDIASYLVFHNSTEFFSVMISLSIFGVAWFTFKQSKNRNALFLGSAIFAGVLFFPSSLPATLVVVQGLTPFKRYAECLLVLLFALSIPAYWRGYAAICKSALLHIMAALILCIVSERSFSGYKSVFYSYNALEHIFKIIAFALIYWGICIVAVNDLCRLGEPARYPSQEIAATDSALIGS